MNALETERRFETSMDRLVLTISIGLIVLIVVIAMQAHSLWVVLFLVAAAIISYALNPSYYSIGDAALRIHRPIGVVTVPLSSIVRVEPLVRLPYIRIFGIGGLFGYYGLYWSKPTGVVRMYGRNRRNPLLLVLHDGKQIVILPDDVTIVDYLPKS